MIKIEKKFKAEEFTAENVIKTLSEKLNKKVEVEQIEIFTETFETVEIDEIVLLQKIVLNVEIDVSKFDVEVFQFTILFDNKQFYDDNEIFDFIDEIVQKIEQ